MKAVEAFLEFKSKYQVIRTDDDLKKFIREIVEFFVNDFLEICKVRGIKRNDAYTAAVDEVNIKCNRTLTMLEEISGKKFIKQDAFRIYTEMVMAEVKERADKMERKADIRPE